jgi:hypothetical protein
MFSGSLAADFFPSTRGNAILILQWRRVDRARFVKFSCTSSFRMLCQDVELRRFHAARSYRKRAS